MSNKTSDKNVAKIEDDVKIVKEFIDYAQGVIDDMEYERPVDVTAYQKDLTSMQNILAELEQDKKRIQELEEERQLVGMPVKNKRDGRIGVVLHQWENGSVAVLENINPRVINTHDSWNTLEIISDEVEQNQTKENSISKRVIIEGLEKIEDYFDRLNGPDEDIEYIRQVKKELLGGENESN